MVYLDDKVLYIAASKKCLYHYLGLMNTIYLCYILIVLCIAMFVYSILALREMTILLVVKYLSKLL